MPSPKIKKTCTHCGREFMADPRSHLCSAACVAAYRYRNSRKTERVCIRCGKHFYDVPSKARKYCSMDCHVKHKIKPKPLCACCNQEMPVGRHTHAKFCSEKCRAEFYSDQSKKCKCCGAWFTPIRWLKKYNKFGPYINMKTCSDRCQKQLTTGRNHHMWNGGMSALNVSTHRGSKWYEIAEKARTRDGHKCRHCGKTQEQNGRKLDVHHLTPYHDVNDTKKANRLSNLISLCRSCHRKVENALVVRQLILPFAVAARTERRQQRALAANA